MKSLVFSTLLAVVPAVAYVAPAAADREIPQQSNFHHEHYDRWNDSHWARDFHGRWQVLGRGFDARNDRQPINVSGNRFHKLRLEAVRGEPKIDRIAIQFTDGTSQNVDVDDRLSAGAGDVIDLDNVGDRRIRRIVVFAEPSTRGLYAVYAG
jgi:hypothetical protein